MILIAIVNILTLIKKEIFCSIISAMVKILQVEKIIKNMQKIYTGMHIGEAIEHEAKTNNFLIKEADIYQIYYKYFFYC